MAVRMIVVSYFTNSWLYPEHARRLKRECDKFGLIHDICELPSTGEWLSNTALKPEFILEKMQEHGEIAWVDVDSTIIENPVKLKQSIRGHACLASHTVLDRRWHVGCMLWRYCPETLRFITQWTENTLSGGTDEAALEKTWQEMNGDEIFIIDDLPMKYHALPSHGKYPKDTIIGMGISTDETKLAMKARKNADSNRS